MADLNNVTVTAQNVRDQADLLIHKDDPLLEGFIAQARSYCLSLTTLETTKMSETDARTAIVLYAAGLAHLKEPRTSDNSKSGRSARRNLNAQGYQNEYFRQFADFTTQFRRFADMSRMR